MVWAWYAQWYGQRQLLITVDERLQPQSVRSHNSASWLPAAAVAVLFEEEFELVSILLFEPMAYDQMGTLCTRATSMANL
jgi:hypothetical protein